MNRENEIKVSIIIPVFNVEQYLAKCLDSALSQTLQDIEIVVVNDGSTDDSQRIIDLYKTKEPNIIKSYIKENGGLSDARNYGLKRAEGKYIFFLDSDDYIDCDLIEKLFTLATKNKSKFVECDFIYEFPDKSVIDKRIGYSTIEEYMLNGRVIACNKLYDRKWLFEIENHFSKGLLYEDVEFFFKCLLHLDSVKEVGYVDSSYYHYLQRAGSITGKSSARVLDIVQIYKNVIMYYKNNSAYSKYESELEYKFVRNCLCSFMKLAIKIEDKTDKKRVIMGLWTSVNTMFPNWRKNKYMKTLNKNNIFMRLYNPIIIRLLLLG